MSTKKPIPRYADGRPYIVCQTCGIGHGRNFLKAIYPLWIQCRGCAKTTDQQQIRDILWALLPDADKELAHDHFRPDAPTITRKDIAIIEDGEIQP